MLRILKIMLGPVIPKITPATQSIDKVALIIKSRKSKKNLEKVVDNFNKYF